MSPGACRRAGKLIFVSLAAMSFCAMTQAQNPPQQAPPTASQQPTPPQSQNTADLLKAVDRLVDQNRKLTDQNQQMSVQNQQLIDEVKQLRQQVEADNPTIATADAQKAAAQLSAEAQAERQTTSQSGAASNQDLRIEESQHPGPKLWGPYTPNFGYKVANTPYGDLSISIYTYARYLNQRNVDRVYTNYFGNTIIEQQRQDIQLNKAQFKFLGWLMDARLRYFLYAWTSNASQGLGAQVVLGGNLNYTFAKYITLGAGIDGLPGVRTLEANFPFWDSVDVRLQADEFFRPSYTQGIFARGTLARGLVYRAMEGNNLSNLGVSAAQLPNHFNTFSSAVAWMPTTGEYGAGFGDFEDHQSIATRFAGHYTRSTETRQSQPNTDQFENVQIRLEDGSIVFVPNLFGPGIIVTQLVYKMMNFDSGIKYRGYELYGGYYQRWLNNFQGPGTTGLPTVVSKGFNVEGSSMLKQKTLMLYVGGSSVYGKYGSPWDIRAGLNYYPFNNRVVRWNNEFLYVYKSATGNNTTTYTVGETGPVFSSTFEVAF